ncbi:MAG: ribulose-phosphate 3-epimerase [Candidatus Aureabacteria bacterium]|nr:ribulose-phosphate 3-epimerase [Candidatus Auribacterota bacterium]
MTSEIQIAPSILAADFGCLREEAVKAEKSGADLLHIDVMDGHFVPNITFGPQVVSMLKQSVSIPLDVHLMISHPDQYLEAFINSGASYLTVHAEANHDMPSTLRMIRSKKVKAGPALNPDRNIEEILPVLPESDIVLVMSVFPGFGGQTFIPNVLEKIKKLVLIRKEKGYHYQIEIDGGITMDNFPLVRDAGVDIVVAGTTLYRAENMNKLIQQMKNQ